MSETPQRGSVWRATAIWAVCTVVGIVLLLVLGPQLAAWHVLPAVASDRAGDIDQIARAALLHPGRHLGRLRLHPP